ncbi:MAG TPA: hypothetical protein VGH45_08980 [Solirubrobacteraceae bacterium]
MPGEAETAPGSAAARERRRRCRHFARRRRDLVEDAVLGLLLAAVLLSVTGGLGVLALIELLVVSTVLGVGVVRRLRGRRSSGAGSLRLPDRLGRRRGRSGLR